MDTKQSYVETPLTDEDLEAVDEPAAPPEDPSTYEALLEAEDVEDPETEAAADDDPLPDDDEELAAPPPPDDDEELEGAQRRKLRTSIKGLAALCSEEGLRLEPYDDSAGHATVGVGHLIHHGPVTSADRAKYRGFTREQAIALLRADVKPREGYVNDAVGVGLNQNEFDSVLSLVFNIGSGNFDDSTVRRKLNAGARREAADAFLMWKKGGAGLIHRRHRERKRFLTPAAPADPLAVLTAGERAWVREYDRLLAGGTNPARRSELRKVLLHRRKVVWRAARQSGWDKANRRARYELLLARTKSA